jgi:hypothetical protein
MSRRYAAKRYSPAQLDAMREGKAAARMARPAPEYSQPRQTGELVLCVNGQRFVCELVPNGRDCRRWNVSINGKAWRTSGLEGVWRHLQAQIAPRLGERNL